METEITLQDLIKKWLLRDASYSQFSSWDWSKEQWFDKYILGIEEPPSPAMTFGNTVGDTLGTPESMVPQLREVPGIKEYKMRVKMGNMFLVGYADHHCPDTLFLNENKTSQNANRWTQKSVDEHKQLDMYGLLLFLQDGVKPEDVRMRLNYIPVVQGGDFMLSLTDPVECYHFETRRTTADITRYSAYIQQTRKEQLEYVKKRFAQLSKGRTKK